MGKGDKFTWPEDATDEIARALKLLVSKEEQLQESKTY